MTISRCIHILNLASFGAETIELFNLQCAEESEVICASGRSVRQAVNPSKLESKIMRISKLPAPNYAFVDLT